MNIYRKALAIVSALAITGTVALAVPAAQETESKAPAKQSQKAQPKPSKTEAVHGSITSITADSVTIREANGKETTLVLDKQTQRAGNLVAGSQVTARYRDEDGKHIAASLHEQTAAAKPKKGKEVPAKPAPQK
jgi:hypothetical protein